MVEFSFSDFFYPLPLARTYFLLRQSEHWSQAQFVQYQSHLLAKLLRFCVGEVPYYGPMFREAGLNPDHIRPDNAMACLNKLPILDKDMVRETPHLFLACDIARFKPKPVATTGTTGTPLTVYWDRSSNVMEICSIQRLWRWAGFRIGQSFLDLRSRVLADDEKHLAKEDRNVRYIRSWKVNGLEFSSDIIDESNIHRYHEILMRYRPRLVRGHPQAIQHLAALLQQTGLDGWRPKAVTTASEALYDFQRRQIEEAWRVPILDSYGLKEHNVFIAQCREGSYHISPEYGICEILDDDGNPAKPGQEGRIVATGLHNYAQPLLRYDTRDRAIAGDQRLCACRRTLPAVERIIGRIDDCVYTREGKRYSGFSFAFFGYPGLKKARLIQEEYDKVTVELVVTPEFGEAHRSALLDALGRKVEHRIKFELRPVAEIVQEAPGKFKFVVSRLKKVETEGQPVSQVPGGNGASWSP